MAILARAGRGGGFIDELAGILGVDSGITDGLDGSAGGSIIGVGADGSLASPFVSMSLRLFATVG